MIAAHHIYCSFSDDGFYDISPRAIVAFCPRIFKVDRKYLPGQKFQINMNICVPAIAFIVYLY